MNLDKSRRGRHPGGFHVGLAKFHPLGSIGAQDLHVVPIVDHDEEFPVGEGRRRELVGAGGTIRHLRQTRVVILRG